MTKRIAIFAFCSVSALILFAYFAFGQKSTYDSSADLQIFKGSWPVPDNLRMRARILSIKPEVPVDVEWRLGGEGMGGEMEKGTLAKNLPIGEWSSFVTVSSIVGLQSPDRSFVTFTCGQPGTRSSVLSKHVSGYSTDVIMEFEFYDGNELLKRFQESGPKGGTVGIVIPFFRLSVDKKLNDPDFLLELDGLRVYSKNRLDALEHLPWAQLPVPKKYAMVSSLGGYGEGIGYGIRTTNPEVMKQELRSLGELGVNGLRGASHSLMEIVHSDFSNDFLRARIINSMGFPVPRLKDASNPLEAGCPFGAGVAKRTQQEVARAVAEALTTDAEEVWARTEDEIGLVVDKSAAGKKHPSVCPQCISAFQKYIKQNGLKPKDFGQHNWGQIKPIDSSIPQTPHNRSEGLLAYYTAKFNNYATAQLFTPLRSAFNAANDTKRASMLKSNAKISATAKQPWIYSYSLRGNTFLLDGHSLDFFNFYRYSDNAFVYETSNRDARVWSWDSYLCDVARTVSKMRNIQFGIYVKPHRGAPMQRALSAIARGARMIYWYTYGPDWVNGDSFAGDDEALKAVSKTGRLIAKVEDVLYESSWIRSPRVAVIKPLSSEIWFRLSNRSVERAAAWENAKWIYTALAHAHIPVDAIDEDILNEVDLSHYRVIYINGPNLTAFAASKISDWVHRGGILYTSGWGLVADEADQPSKTAEKLLGLSSRSRPEIWSPIDGYEGVGLGIFGQPHQVVTPIHNPYSSGENPFRGEISLQVGREILDPRSHTEVLARFSDGGVAVTRNKFGKGFAYTIGFFPGLEYSAGLRKNSFNMSTDFDQTIRNFISAPAESTAERFINCSQPTVEGQFVQSVSSKRRAIILINWAYRSHGWKRNESVERNPVYEFFHTILHSLFRPEDSFADLVPVVELVPVDHLTLNVYGSGPVSKVYSAALNQELEHTSTGTDTTIQLPRLEEGDVLLLE